MKDSQALAPIILKTLIMSRILCIHPHHHQLSSRIKDKTTYSKDDDQLPNPGPDQYNPLNPNVVARSAVYQIHQFFFIYSLE
jgi:hypothetical protein